MQITAELLIETQAAAALIIQQIELLRIQVTVHQENQITEEVIHKDPGRTQEAGQSIIAEITAVMTEEDN